MNKRKRQRQYQEKYHRKFSLKWFKYCREPLENIKGWEEMLNDTSNTIWHLHHLAEIQGDTVVSKDELKNRGEYYNISAEKLIFITASEHASLHNSGDKNPLFGRIGDKNPMFGYNKYNIQPEELHELYIVQGLTQQEISDIFGCSQYLICRHLKKYNIKRGS